MSLPRLAALGAALSVMSLPAPAWAATNTFDRLEVIATADYRNVTKVCDDGTTATSRVRITGGHEEERENSVSTLDRDYTLVQIQSGCTGRIIQARTNDLDFVWSQSLQTASLAGTFTTSAGDTISLDIAWSATGPTEVDTNNVSFPGRTSTFVGRQRDASATGTVSLNGKTLVNGSTTTGTRIESLDDHTVTTQ
jgi:hypothetical protein